VLREYRHGGLLGAVLGGLFLLGDRAATETAALAAARKAGVSVARPVAAVRRPVGPLYRAHLVTEAVEEAADLVARLRARHERCEAFDAAPVLVSAGRSLRRLHEAGIAVHDLHVKNVLVPRGDPSTSTLVDFDRARVLGRPVPRARRLADLFRMDRSLEKLARSGVPLARRERARLFRGYRNGDRIPVDERRDACRRYRRHLALHRLSWRLRGR
jgi:tRNA A-37 threonylcarbamoyl transferase component Bud32